MASRSAARPWLLGAPLAWATSAALVLAEGALWTVFPLALWGLCLGGRRLAVSLLAALVPLQATAALAAEVAGPAHFHLGTRADHPAERAGIHRHGSLQRHYHSADAGAIEIEQKSPLAQAKRPAPAADAFIVAAPGVALASFEGAPPPGAVLPPSPHFLPSPERPPRAA